MIIGWLVRPSVLEWTERLIRKVGRNPIEILYWIIAVLLAIGITANLYTHIFLPSGRRFIISTGLLVTGLVASTIATFAGPLQILEGFILVRGVGGQNPIGPIEGGIQMDAGARLGNSSSQWPTVVLIAFLMIFYVLLCLWYFFVHTWEVHGYNVLRGRRETGSSRKT